LPTVAELAQQELSRRYSLQGRTQVAPRVQTMQNARPTVRSALSNLMRDAVDATGLEGGYRQGLLNAAGGVETAVDFLPVVGDVLGLEDASSAYGQGDMVGAGINMMGVVPVFGDVAAKGAKSALRGINAYHGSPHEFQRFSMDKIGTGEGAQAYGSGLYFAEQKSVAEGYRDNLSRGKLIGGTLASGNLINEIPYDRSGNIDANRLNRVIKDREYALSGRDSYESELREWERYEADFGSDAGPMPDYLASKGSWDAEIAKEAEKLKMLKKVQSDPSSVSEVEGQLYNVNLNVDPNELLDWDAPLSEQSEKIRKIIAGDEELKYLTDTYGMDSLLIKSKSAEGSADLASRGILGIKYLDGFSRSAGEGTRNYVMFDDSLIDTKRVNDQLTPSWMNPEARMQRAQDLGFDTDNVFYHGTSSDFAELQPSSVGDLGGGVYVTPNPEKASGYAAVRKFMKRQTNNAGPNVLPLRVKSNLNYLDLEGSSIMPFDEARIQSLKDQGYEGIRQFDADGNVIQMNVFDPKNIRSTNAEFDPTKADSADLLSSVGATSALRGIV
jgi:hypothetical protein